VRSFATAQQCIAALREEQCTLWCTALTQSAKDLHAVLRQSSVTTSRRPQASGLHPDGLSTKESQRGGVTAGVSQSSTALESDGPATDGGEAPPQRLAVAFSGSEAEGVSRELLDAADQVIYLPLHGEQSEALPVLPQAYSQLQATTGRQQ
jgi:hypothetical protein